MARILRYVEATANKDFLVAVRAAYDRNGRPDLAAYRQAHHEYQLDAFWEKFAESARKIMDDSKPGGHSKL